MARDDDDRRRIDAHRAPRAEILSQAGPAGRRVSATAVRWERNAAFRARVLAGEPVFGTFLSMGSAVSAELCGRAGFDWCLVDLEHGLGGEGSLHVELVAVELTGAAALVRVESGAPLRIGRVLDHGAAGVMIPRLRSASEAAAAVSCARYPPAGARGVALSVRGAEFGRAAADEVGLIDQATTMLIQIENDAALADVDAIAATDGVDVLFVGPNDLTHSLGIPGRFDDARYLDALASVSDAARSAGKAAGVMLRSTGEVEALRRLGYSFFALSTDCGLLAEAARSGLAAMRAAG
jgi:2-dehydro-3-deoxyglucarate aldolase/4-hydroxy-2-oxoheptanedioate aldolase